jgi:hypothetical protein
MANHTSWTDNKEELFIQELAKRGNISEACRVAGLPRSTVYEWRDSFPLFKQRWDDTLIQVKEALEAEVYRRAKEGVDAYQEGKLVRKYSDTLAIFLLKAMDREKYQDRIDVGIKAKQMASQELETFLDKLRIADPEAYDRVIKVASESGNV